MRVVVRVALGIQLPYSAHLPHQRVIALFGVEITNRSRHHIVRVVREFPSTATTVVKLETSVILLLLLLAVVVVFFVVFPSLPVVVVVVAGRLRVLPDLVALEDAGLR